MASGDVDLFMETCKTGEDQMRSASQLQIVEPVIAITLAVRQLAYSLEAKTTQVRKSRGLDGIASELRAAYAAFNRGDFDAAVAALDPKIERTEPSEFPGGGTDHGR